MTTYNKLAAIKELGAIEHRINDANLDRRIKATCISRNLDNLLDTLPPKFHGIILRCDRALRLNDYLELVAGLVLIRSLIPITYGMLPAGASFKIPSYCGTFIKRKGWVEIDGSRHLHPPANTRVIEVA
jgi:hypothetical protein